MGSAKRGKALVLLAIALSAGGCAKDDEGDRAVPVACKEGRESVQRALTRAPARVEVDGTALSECFTRGSDGADLQQVGATYLSVAARLSDQARLRPNGPEALQLGYLVGAVRRGAAATQGVHAEIARRIEQEAIGVDTGSAAYRRGYEAGRSRG